MKNSRTFSLRAGRTARLAALLLWTLLPVLVAGAAWQPAQTTRTFSVIEALGLPGTTVTIGMQVPSGSSLLWIKAHGLNYQNKASIRVNGGAWINLNNTNCVFDYPGDRLNGMGGPMDVLSFRVLGVSLIPRRVNTISFRFNYSDGTSIGYRVLDVCPLNSSGRRLLPEAVPVFARPRTTGLGAADVLAGSNLWYNATLRESWVGPTMNARCSDCHAETGADLRYYSFSDRAISERARFHGMTLAEGRQVATYIRSLPGKNPGTPWDPPYQPGPGLDSRPADEWAAGAGHRWVLPDDVITFDYLYPDGSTEPRFTNTVNMRELPVAMSMPDWNEWLPHLHWKDSFGAANFARVDAAYRELRAASTPAQVRDRMSGWNVALVDWINNERQQAPEAFLTNAYNYYRAWDGVARWRTVKTWEVFREKGMEGRGQETFDYPVHPRTLPGQTIFFSAPHFSVSTLQSGHHLRDGSIEMWSVRSHQWYWMQMLLNDTNKRRQGSAPIDWPYLLAFNAGMARFGLANAAQITAAQIKSGEAAMYNPRDYFDGFTGMSNIRLEFLWPREGADVWAGYDPAFRDAVLRGWIEEYSRWIHELGREHFRDVTGELADGETDNSPGPPHAWPWIRAHSAMIAHFKGRGAAPDIVATLKEIAQYLWPAADWSMY